jgi:hypothetical protein
VCNAANRSAVVEQLTSLAARGDFDAALTDRSDRIALIAPQGPNAAALVGQLLAYGGVLGLTVGTAMVVWGYFGGPQSFAPTGWLIATLGQMLLFLGVVTLVSGGMEQTTEEVARRIDRLGERLIRIEQASRDHALRGPSIPAERFAEQPARSTGRERVGATTRGDG